MADPADRVRRLEDIEEIRQLKARYCAACDDDHNGAAVAALFIETGTWHQVGSDPNVGTHAIAAFMFGIRNSKMMARSAHMVTNPVIAVDGDHAIGAWRLLMMFTHADEQAFTRIIGRYEDTYLRVDDRWYFESLKVFVEESGTYAATSMRV